MPISEDPTPIRRCVCADVTFEELAHRGVRTMEEAEAQGCGVTCGLCRPSLERMVETGEIAFPLSPPEGSAEAGDAKAFVPSAGVAFQMERGVP